MPPLAFLTRPPYLSYVTGAALAAPVLTVLLPLLLLGGTVRQHFLLSRHDRIRGHSCRIWECVSPTQTAFLNCDPADLSPVERMAFALPLIDRRGKWKQVELRLQKHPSFTVMTVCKQRYLLDAQGSKSKRRAAQPKTPAGASREADTSDSNGGGKRSSAGKKARAGRPQ